MEIEGVSVGLRDTENDRVPSGVHMALDFIDDAVRAQN